MFRLHFQMLASCFPINLDKEVTGSIRRDSSGEKSNQNVMISATNDVFTLNKGLFRKCPCQSQQGHQMYCFPLDKARTSVIKPFPCLTLAWFTRNSRLGTPPNYYPPSMTCLARGKWHTIYSTRTEIACAPSSQFL